MEAITIPQLMPHRFTGVVPFRKFVLFRLIKNLIMINYLNYLFQGTWIVDPVKKKMIFPFMVPSFLTKPGNYAWSEIFQTKNQEKTEVFLTVRTLFNIAMD